MTGRGHICTTDRGACDAPSERELVGDKNARSIEHGGRRKHGVSAKPSTGSLLASSLPPKSGSRNAGAFRYENEWPTTAQSVRSLGSTRKGHVSSEVPTC